MYRYLVLLFFACSFYACKPKTGNTLVIAPSKDAIIKDSAYAKMYITDKEIRRESVDYIPFDFSLYKEKNAGVLKICKKTISNKELTKSTTQIQIQPVYFTAQSAHAKKYSVDVNADEISFKEASIFAKKNGNDTTEDWYSVYNPLNGEMLLSFTNDYYDLVIPNSKERRYIGFQSTKTEFKSGKETTDHLLGNLFYASNMYQIQQLQIKVLDEKLYKNFSLYTPKMVLSTSNKSYTSIDDGRRIALMNISEQNTSMDFSNIVVEITFYYGTDAQELICFIPITDDKLDLANARYDKKLLEIK